MIASAQAMERHVVYVSVIWSKYIGLVHALLAKTCLWRYTPQQCSPVSREYPKLLDRNGDAHV